jgi:hypothetical protein
MSGWSLSSLSKMRLRAIKCRHLFRVAGLSVRCGLPSALEFLNLCLLLNDLGVEVLPCRSNFIFHGWCRPMSSSASCAISGSGKRVREHSGADPPGETTLDPWLDDPFPRLQADDRITLGVAGCPAGGQRRGCHYRHLEPRMVPWRQAEFLAC